MLLLGRWCLTVFRVVLRARARVGRAFVGCAWCCCGRRRASRVAVLVMRARCWCALCVGGWWCCCGAGLSGVACAWLLVSRDVPGAGSGAGVVGVAGRSGSHALGLRLVLLRVCVGLVCVLWGVFVGCRCLVCVCVCVCVFRVCAPVCVLVCVCVKGCCGGTSFGASCARPCGRSRWLWCQHAACWRCCCGAWFVCVLLPGALGELACCESRCSGVTLGLPVRWAVGPVCWTACVACGAVCVWCWCCC